MKSSDVTAVAQATFPQVTQAAFVEFDDGTKSMVFSVGCATITATAGEEPDGPTRLELLDQFGSSWMGVDASPAVIVEGRTMVERATMTLIALALELGLN